MATLIDLPDPKKCRTKLVRDELYSCLMKNGYRCHYAIRFNSDFYCDHQDRRNFGENYPSRGTHDEFDS